MDHDMSKKLEGWWQVRAEEIKIWEAGVDQRRRGAMLSVQSKAIK